MATIPIRPGAEFEEIDTETERIINERLATFDEDVKTTSPWSDVEARILKALQAPQPH